MKQTWTYYRIKWTAFGLTIFILSIGLAIVLSANRLPEQTIPQESPSPLEQSANGYYSNEDFSRLLEKNLKEFDLISALSFQGIDEGEFTIQGKLEDSARLIALCPELTTHKEKLSALEGEFFTLNGHLGENEDGTGRLIADTIHFENQEYSAGEATFYIDQYTTVNSFFAVPFDQIQLDQRGITFQKELPAIIQTA